MPNINEYEIPIDDTFDTDEKTGVYVLIGQDNGITLIDYTGDTPYDLISLYQHEVYQLVKILILYLTSKTQLHMKFESEYGEYRND